MLRFLGTSDVPVLVAVFLLPTLISIEGEAEGPQGNGRDWEPRGERDSETEQAEAPGRELAVQLNVQRLDEGRLKEAGVGLRGVGTVCSLPV